MIRDMYAFPFAAEKDRKGNFISHGNTGMTLRMYIATQAMQSLIATDISNGYSYNKIAKDAYEMADAMIEEAQK